MPEFSKRTAKFDANSNLYKLHYSIFITSIGSACCSIIEASCGTPYVSTSPLQSGVSKTQPIAVALYSALLVFYKAKGANINIFHGVERDLKLLCKPYFSSRVMKEILELYLKIQSYNFISQSEISNENKHKVNQTSVGEVNCAALVENHCPRMSVPVDYQCIKAELFQHFVAETNTVWKNGAGNLTAKLFMEKIDFRRLESLINLPRVDLTILTELMSGH